MKLVIHPDTDYENPRDWDNLFTMAFYHKRYLIGDKKEYEDHNDLDSELKTGKYIFYPVYMYDHSGLVLSLKPFSCPFDSGLLGYMYATKEKIKNDFDWKSFSKQRLEKIYSLAESEIKVLNNYLSGEVYCFQLVDNDGEIIDSCSGFFGTNIKMNGIMDHIDEKYRSEVINKGYDVYQYFHENNL